MPLLPPAFLPFSKPSLSLVSPVSVSSPDIVVVPLMALRLVLAELPTTAEATANSLLATEYDVPSATARTAAAAAPMVSGDRE